MNTIPKGICKESFEMVISKPQAIIFFMYFVVMAYHIPVFSLRISNGHVVMDLNVVSGFLNPLFIDALCCIYQRNRWATPFSFERYTVCG